jgi:hypothetical protein
MSASQALSACACTPHPGTSTSATPDSPANTANSFMVCHA